MQSTSHFYPNLSPSQFQNPGGVEILNPDVWGQDMSQFGVGLDHAGQLELMHSLETDGMEDIQQMVTSATRFWNAQASAYET